MRARARSFCSEQVAGVVLQGQLVLALEGLRAGVGLVVAGAVGAAVALALGPRLLGLVDLAAEPRGLRLQPHAHLDELLRSPGVLGRRRGRGGGLGRCARGLCRGPGRPSPGPLTQPWPELRRPWRAPSRAPSPAPSPQPWREPSPRPWREPWLEPSPRPWRESSTQPWPEPSPEPSAAALAGTAAALAGAFAGGLGGRLRRGLGRAPSPRPWPEPSPRPWPEPSSRPWRAPSTQPWPEPSTQPWPEPSRAPSSRPWPWLPEPRAPPRTARGRPWPARGWRARPAARPSLRRPRRSSLLPSVGPSDAIVVPLWFVGPERPRYRRGAWMVRRSCARPQVPRPWTREGTRSHGRPGGP